MNAPSLRTQIETAVQEGLLASALEPLERAIYFKGDDVSSLYAELKADNTAPLVQEAFDSLLDELTAQDGALTRAKGNARVATFALPGVLAYRGEHVLLQADRCQVFERAIADCLGVPASDVRMAPWMTSADTAYMMPPAAAVAFCAAQRHAHLLGDSVNKPRVAGNFYLPSRGATRYQAVMLFSVKLEPGDDVRSVAQELKGALSLSQIELQFTEGLTKPVFARFTPFGIELPWTAFQKEVYRFETMFLNEMVLRLCRAHHLQPREVTCHLSAFAADSDDYSEVRVLVCSRSRQWLGSYCFPSVGDSSLLCSKALDILTAHGTTVRICRESQAPQPADVFWHRDLGLVSASAETD